MLTTAADTLEHLYVWDMSIPWEANPLLSTSMCNEQNKMRPMLRRLCTPPAVTPSTQKRSKSQALHKHNHPRLRSSSHQKYQNTNSRIKSTHFSKKSHIHNFETRNSTIRKQNMQATRTKVNVTFELSSFSCHAGERAFSSDSVWFVQYWGTLQRTTKQKRQKIRIEHRTKHIFCSKTHWNYQNL